MAIGKDQGAGRQLRTLLHLGAVAELSDGQLLERFATDHGEAAELAFAALVERHGPMVLRVCRSVLDDPHASDDAFQATFLVLVARGRTLWVRDSLGPWLHQVAHRTARCARSNAARRKRLERAASLTRSDPTSRPEPADEVERVLLEEIDRLPDRYRAPVVLCDLEGQTHEAAARALGWPIGTVKSRQARARERLRQQLTRRGFAPANGLAILALPRLGLSISALLVNSTTRLAVGRVATRTIVRGSTAWLAEEVIRSMTILRSVKVATLLLAFGAAGSGAGLIAQGSGEAPQKPDPQARPQVQAQAEPKPKPKTEENAQEPAPALDKSSYQVKPGKIELTESAKGNLGAAVNLDVLSEIEGTTTIIMIKPEGTMVHKGEVVAELDSALLRDTLVNQQIASQQAQAAYKQASLVREVAEYAVKEYLEGVLPGDRGSFKEKIAFAEKGLKDGEARLEQSRAARKKLDEMFAATKGPATPSDIVADVTLSALLETAERSLADHKRDLEMARKDLEILEKYTQEKTTRQLKVDLEKARGDELNKLGRWDAEKGKEKKLERQIEKCTLRAPGDGMVYHANDRAPTQGRPLIFIEEGATVRQRQLIFRVIAPNTPMVLSIKIPESRIDQIKTGQKATIRVDALRNRTFTGTVSTVAPLPDANTLNSDVEKVYTTRIKIDPLEPGFNLRPGMSASAEIVYGMIENVLIVPARAVSPGGFNAKNWVTVKTPDGKRVQRDVTTGASDGEFVEIESGLKAGEIVDLSTFQ